MYRNFYKRRYYNRGPDAIDKFLDLISKLTQSLFVFIVNLLKQPQGEPLGTIRESPNTELISNKSKYQYSEKNEEDFTGKYELKTSLLTPTEGLFLEVLKQVVGNRYQIVPQLQLSRIMEVKDSDSHFTNYHDFNLIAKKSIDFVLCDESMKPCVAIELDDYSHFRSDRRMRDKVVNEIMQSAGLRLIRIPVSRNYDLLELERLIFN